MYHFKNYVGIFLAGFIVFGFGLANAHLILQGNTQYRPTNQSENSRNDSTTIEKVACHFDPHQSTLCLYRSISSEFPSILLFEVARMSPISGTDNVALEQENNFDLIVQPETSNAHQYLVNSSSIIVEGEPYMGVNTIQLPCGRSEIQAQLSGSTQTTGVVPFYREC